MKRPLLLAAAALLAACNVNVEPQFRVKDVRVLAVRSGVVGGTAADAGPGDTLKLDALVANPLGRAGLTIDWFACLPGASDAVSACSDLASLADPGRLAADPSVLALGRGPSVQLLVPALPEALAFVIQRAKQRPIYTCSLYAEIVVVVVASAEGQRSIAVKTVRVKPPAQQIAAAGVQDHYALNVNPRISDVVRAPSSAETCAGGTSLLRAPFPAGRTVICGQDQRTEETYDVCGPAELQVTPTPDLLVWQWYVTDGDFPKEGGVGNARGNDLEFDRPAGPFTLWAIARDDRGGTDWVTVLVSAP